MQAPEVLGGRYELRGILGRGGMAEVRDGWDNRLDRPVAIKLMHPAFSGQPDDRRRFEAEARAAAALNHANIVAVHDTGEYAGTPYIVMERLSGRTLADELMRGPLPQHRVQAILGAVLSALEQAHAAGILHRDIKPANILLTPSGGVKVADFGIAKSAGTPATMTGHVVGTMAYLSPDRLAGRPATVADDLYAVGAVGYEALTGHKPFPQDNLVALARAISETEPPPLRARRPDVEPGLAQTIERAMARDAQWRYPSASSMRAALIGGPQPGAVRPPTLMMSQPLPAPPTMTVASPPSQRRRLLLLGAVLLALVLGAVLVVFEVASPTSNPGPVITSTSSPPTTTTVAPAPPVAPPPPAQVDEGPPGKKGNGPKKPKHERGDG